uniref:Uncharacterized protein n=1 Tax=Salix viminalis TaxID=40686 RepID=A0A6N2KG26_SALVM
MPFQISRYGPTTPLVLRGNKESFFPSSPSNSPLEKSKKQSKEKSTGKGGAVASTGKPRESGLTAQEKVGMG